MTVPRPLQVVSSEYTQLGPLKPSGQSGVGSDVGAAETGDAVGGELGEELGDNVIDGEFVGTGVGDGVGAVVVGGVGAEVGPLVVGAVVAGLAVGSRVTGAGVGDGVGSEVVGPGVGVAVGDGVVSAAVSQLVPLNPASQVHAPLSFTVPAPLQVVAALTTLRRHRSGGVGGRQRRDERQRQLTSSVSFFWRWALGTRSRPQDSRAGNQHPTCGCTRAKGTPNKQRGLKRGDLRPPCVLRARHHVALSL